jgi:hypothetical protein
MTTGINRLRVDRARNRILTFFPDLNQTCAQKLFKQRYKVAVATFRLDIVFLQQNITNLRNPARHLQQVPNVRSNWVQSVINAIFHIEDGRFCPKSAGDLILGDRNDRLLRKTHFLRFKGLIPGLFVVAPQRDFNGLSTSEQIENDRPSCLNLGKK